MFSRAPRQKVNAVATLGASSVLHIEHAPPPASGEAEREAAATQQHDLGSDASERAQALEVTRARVGGREVPAERWEATAAEACAAPRRARRDESSARRRRHKVRWARAQHVLLPCECGA